MATRASAIPNENKGRVPGVIVVTTQPCSRESRDHARTYHAALARPRWSDDDDERLLRGERDDLVDRGVTTEEQCRIGLVEDPQAHIRVRGVDHAVFGAADRALVSV